jgi:hypothetical protein
MKNWVRLLLLVLPAFAVFAGYIFWLHSRSPFDMSAFTSLLNFYASLVIAAVTALYVIYTKRYVEAFERETKTRQATLEEWEMRRFYGSRMFAIGDGLAELFFASKRELEVFLVQIEALSESVGEISRGAIASVSGPGTISPAVESRVNNLWDTAYVRYNERAKDHNWRAQVLIHQAQTLLPPDLCAELGVIFKRLSRAFYDGPDGLKLLSDFEAVAPDVTRIVQEIHTLAANRVAQNPGLAG